MMYSKSKKHVFKALQFLEIIKFIICTSKFPSKTQRKLLHCFKFTSVSRRGVRRILEGGGNICPPPPLPKAKHVFIYHTYDMDDMVAANWHDGYQCCGAGAGLFSRCR